MKRSFTRGEHHRHRSSFSRALNAQGGAKVSFCDVPDQFTVLVIQTIEEFCKIQKIDDKVFLQVKEEDMHLFYRKKTMKLAVKAGLHTIICDGVHGFHPSELGRKAQLYGLHAVCGDAQAKPFAYAVTINKLTATYLKVFQNIASRLEKYGADINQLNVVLDYETAAHNAAEQVGYFWSAQKWESNFEGL